MKSKLLFIASVALAALYSSLSFAITCPSISDVKSVISKLNENYEVDGIVAAGATWTAKTNFSQKDIHNPDFHFFYATLNPDISLGGPGAVVCSFEDVNDGSFVHTINFTTPGTGNAITLNNNWASCGATSCSQPGKDLCCGPGGKYGKYSNASSPEQCTFEINK